MALPDSTHLLFDTYLWNYKTISLILSIYLSYQTRYRINTLLSKFKITINTISKGFAMLEIFLRTLIPSLGGICHNPDNLIKLLVTKNKESLQSFHAKVTQIQNQLKPSQSQCGLNKLLVQYLNYISRTSNITEYTRNNYTKLLGSLQKKGDNLRNIFSKSIADIFNLSLLFENNKIIQIK